MVARHLAKVEVAGSNPVARSMIYLEPIHSALFIFGEMAKW